MLVVFIERCIEMFEGTLAIRGHTETKHGQGKGVHLRQGSSLPEPIPVPNKRALNNDDKQGRGGPTRVQPQNACKPLT